jgi:hypothetical protein
MPLSLLIRTALLSALCFSGAALTAQNALASKSLHALRVAEPPKIDGRLDEPIWITAQPATDFVENSPEPNTPSDFRTEVRIVYDDQAIYVGAMLYDPEPDKILRQMSTRDDFYSVNADKFAVSIDGQLSRQNAFAFGVTAAGVEVDAYVTAFNEDSSWDGAWFSAVQIVDNGWAVEMKIPYSQLRFPPKSEQTWGINFYREVRRVRENAYWNPIDPAVSGEVQQYGTLTGIQEVKPPLRLQLLPYLVAGAQFQNDGLPDTRDFRPRIGGGMDLKFGINESTTLDMALVPDFTDVLSDDQQLNLGPFELFFEERRPFFTEGVEIFNRGGIFYSRRVGATPEGYYAAYDSLRAGETVVNNPSVTPLYNATKVSGRSKQGWGFGVFNAITGPTFATLEGPDGDQRQVRTGGLANYNVVVVDKLLKNNSFYSFTNTNVLRAGAYQDANVSAVEMRQAGRRNQFALQGNFAFSQLFRPGETVRGFKAFLSYGKTNGAWRYAVSQNIESDRYDPNDLGFLYIANKFNHVAWVSYNQFKPLGPYNNFSASLTFERQMLFRPMQFVNAILYADTWGTFRNFLSAGFSVNWMPVTSYNYFEARTEGYKFAFPKKIESMGWFSSDYRKKFALDGDYVINTCYGGQFARRVIGGSLSPILRASDRLSFRGTVDATLFLDDVGYAARLGDGTPLLGMRDRQNLLTSLNATYTFNPRLSLSMRVRHYWAVVAYDRYFTLRDDGTLNEHPYAGSADLNYNAFNVDLFLRWRFAPGSELNFTYKNQVLQSGDQPLYDYFDNLGQLFGESQFHSWTLKVLYFLEPQRFFGRRNRTDERF